MGNIATVFRREFASYFDSPLAYIVVPIFLGLVAAFSLWFEDIFATGVVTLRTVFFWSGVFFLLLAPSLTMRLFAEEQRTGSLEILVTLPVTEMQIVVGKYLAAVALLGVALLLTASYPITLAVLGELDPGPVMGGYLGLFLLGAAFCAIGMAASAFTSNQVVAFMLSLILCLIPFAMGFFLQQVPSAILPFVQYVSFDYHFDNMARGVLDTRDLVFYGTVIAVGLQVGVFALSWRRLR